MSVQEILDFYLSMGHLRTVTDMEYIETEGVIVVSRTEGHRGAVIDVNRAHTIGEAMEIVIHHVAVY